MNFADVVLGSAFAVVIGVALALFMTHGIWIGRHAPGRRVRRRMRRRFKVAKRELVRAREREGVEVWPPALSVEGKRIEQAIRDVFAERDALVDDVAAQLRAATHDGADALDKARKSGALRYWEWCLRADPIVLDMERAERAGFPFQKRARNVVKGPTGRYVRRATKRDSAADRRANWEHLRGIALNWDATVAHLEAQPPHRYAPNPLEGLRGVFFAASILSPFMLGLRPHRRD